MKATILKISGLFIFLLAVISASAQDRAMISGKIISTEKETVDFATVYLKGTTYGGTTNEQGIYHLKAPAGDYTLVVSAIGYKTVEKPVKLTGGERTRQNITITPQSTELDEVVVVSNGISRLKRSAFNAVALDTKELQNSNKSLSEALAKAPGMKVRESGGVGSDMQLTLDGFSGKHVKIFIDGVPQEGVHATALAAVAFAAARHQRHVFDGAVALVRALIQFAPRDHRAARASLQIDAHRIGERGVEPEFGHG